MHVKNGCKDLKRYSQISRRVRDTLALLFYSLFSLLAPRALTSSLLFLIFLFSLCPLTPLPSPPPIRADCRLTASVTVV